MSERLIQKASTLRKPKRSTLLSLPGGRPPSPVFLPLASDTLCYSRMISGWPPPRLLFLSIRVLPLYLHFFFVFLLYYPIVHSPCLLYIFYSVNYCCYSSTVFFFEIFYFILCLFLCSFLLDLDLFLSSYLLFSISILFIEKIISLSLSLSCARAHVSSSILPRFSYSRGAIWE